MCTQLTLCDICSILASVANERSWKDGTMTQRIGAREARNRFADLMGLVHYGKQSIIVDRAGRPMVAIIPVEVYQQLVAERDARFEVLEHIRGRLPEVAPEEVDQDVSQAISAVRAAESTRQTPSHPPAGD